LGSNFADSKNYRTFADNQQKPFEEDEKATLDHGEAVSALPFS
jgi:hypothetical protein